MTKKISTLCPNRAESRCIGCAFAAASPLTSSLARSEVKEEGPSHNVQIVNLIWNWYYKDPLLDAHGVIISTFGFASSLTSLMARSKVKEEGPSHTDQIVNLIWNWFCKNSLGAHDIIFLTFGFAAVSPMMSLLARSKVKEEGPSHTFPIVNWICYKSSYRCPLHHHLNLRVFISNLHLGRRKDQVTLLKFYI